MFVQSHHQSILWILIPCWKILMIAKRRIFHVRNCKMSLMMLLKTKWKKFLRRRHRNHLCLIVLLDRCKQISKVWNRNGLHPRSIKKFMICNLIMRKRNHRKISRMMKKPHLETWINQTVKKSFSSSIK